MSSEITKKLDEAMRDEEEWKNINILMSYLIENDENTPHLIAELIFRVSDTSEEFSKMMREVAESVEAFSAVFGKYLY